MPALPQKHAGLRACFFMVSDKGPVFSENIIGEEEQEEGMGGVENVKKVFHARAFLVVVTQHQGKGEDHKPLGGSDASVLKHFRTELADAEDDIGDAE